MTFLETISRFVERGSKTLDLLHEVQQDIPDRRFKGGDIESRVLMPVTTIYPDEENGKLPIIMERGHLSRRLGYTLKEINILQDHYGTSPRRKEGDDPVTLSFTNQKGGCWKSTTASYCASYYANLGYRVLLIDLDPQATITENFGFQPNIRIKAENTLSPYINKMEGYYDEDVTSIILDTHVENLKLIPSCLDMGYVDILLTSAMLKAQTVEHTKEESDAIQKDGFTRVRQLVDIAAQEFDIVIMDGTPSLGLLPINIVLASDVLVVPVPTEACDFAATISFFRILIDEYGTIESLFGSSEADQIFPTPIIIPTRYSSASTTTIGADAMLASIHDTFGVRCTDGYIKKLDSVVSNLSMLRRTIFDVNAGIIKTTIGDIVIKSDARKKASQIYAKAFDQILNEEIKPFWPSRASELKALKTQNEAIQEVV